MNLKKLNQILYCKQICKFNHFTNCFLRGKGVCLLCFVLCTRKKPATHGVRVITTLVLRSAPFPLNNPQTLHASIVANLEKSLQLFSKFDFTRKFASQIFRLYLISSIIKHSLNSPNFDKNQTFI